MNEASRNDNPLDVERLLDQLVDGELDEAERRALLERFEREPAQWRSCALAFLEAQAIRESLEGMHEANAPAPENTPVVASRDVSLRQVKHATKSGMSTWIGMAVGFAIAFVLGMSIATSWTSSTILDAPPVERFAVDDDSDERVAPAPAVEEALPAPTNLGDPDSWRLVSLSGDGLSGDEPLMVPCVERPSLDRGWLEASSMRPNAWIDYEHGAPRAIQHVRRHVAIPANDGRTVIVPVDELNVRPLSPDDYQ